MHRINVGKAAGKILLAIQHNNAITIPQLASLIGVTERSIERNIQKLQAESRLKRVGGRKKGHWEVTL
jgi:ATP-dependent DNA helicase RecG